MGCTPCLSLWERWPSEAKTERAHMGATPSQSPSVTALPREEPRGCTNRMFAREMERIRTDTLHFPSYDHPLNYRPFFPLDMEPFPLYNTFNNSVNC